MPATTAIAVLLAGCGTPDPYPIKIENAVERTGLKGAHLIETSPPAAGCGTTYTFTAVETAADIRLTWPSTRPAAVTIPAKGTSRP